jgi:hypothetical protein
LETKTADDVQNSMDNWNPILLKGAINEYLLLTRRALQSVKHPFDEIQDDVKSNQGQSVNWHSVDSTFRQTVTDFAEATCRGAACTAASFRSALAQSPLLEDAYLKFTGQNNLNNGQFVFNMYQEILPEHVTASVQAILRCTKSNAKSIRLEFRAAVMWYPDVRERKASFADDKAKKTKVMAAEQKRRDSWLT